MSNPDFWNNKENADRVVKKISQLKNIIEPFQSLKKSLHEADEIMELFLGIIEFMPKALYRLNAGCNDFYRSIAGFWSYPGFVRLSFFLSSSFEGSFSIGHDLLLQYSRSDSR